MSDTKKPKDPLVDAAWEGDVEAQHALGMLNELGLVPGASLSQAIRWYRRAAQSGDGAAALSLATIFEKGTTDAAPDPVLAKTYTNLAAENGFRPAQVRLQAAGLLPKRSVLLVDSSLENRRKISSALSQSGYQIHETGDAQAALTILQGKTPVDLVISEIDLPLMDGVEFLAFIRKSLRKVQLPIVIVSAVRDTSVVQKAKSYRIQGWILKPFKEDLLLRTIRKCLKERS